MIDSAPRVLVVDDDEDVRKLTRRSLTDVGFHCDIAADGSEARKRVHSTQYDVVITDLRMPHMNGHALCVDLLAMDNAPLVFVLTGVVEPRLANDLTIRGVEHIFYKPVSYPLLASQVKERMRRRNAQGQEAGNAPGGGSSTAGPAEESRTNDESQSNGERRPNDDERRSSDEVEIACRETPPETVAASSASGPEPIRSKQTKPATTSKRSEQAPRPETNGRADGSVDREGESPAEAQGLGKQTQHRVVLLLDEAQRAGELAERLSAETAQVTAASSSEALYEILNGQRIDLIVLEHELGGFLSGLEIVERLKQDLLCPDTILLSATPGEVTERVESLGIEKVLNSSCDFHELQRAVREALRVMSQPNAFISQQARQLVQQFSDLPPVPQLLVKLTNYLSMPVEEIPLQELADDISVDTRATAELLKLTNSSSLGLSQRVTKVLDAVNLLGAKRAISLIFTSATMETQNELLRGWPEDLAEWYQRRSVLIASTAATFAEQIEKVSADTAFVLGLLQDVGILVMAKTSSSRYFENTLRRVREIGQVQLHALEEEDFKLTHADVSAALLQKWELPQTLVRPVLDHHCTKMPTDRTRTELKFLHAMQIGEAMANLSDVAHPARRQILNRLMSEYGPRQMNTCRSCFQEAVTKAEQSLKLFSVPVPEGDELNRLLEEAAHVLDAPSQSPDSPESSEPTGSPTP